MEIGKSDLLWNYTATFLKLTSSVLLLPFILRKMPSETIGLWSIFVSVTSFAGLLDLGFSASFARNVTYIFSGVQSLKSRGVNPLDQAAKSINYDLLKATIKAMRWFYFRMATVLFILLVTFGTYYISTLLKNYPGNQKDVYYAWLLLCLLNTYNLFTLYYEALLHGKGLVRKSKQILIAGQGAYLTIAALLIWFEFGLIAIVSAQISSIIIVRFLSYRAFFDSFTKTALQSATAQASRDILVAIYPNSLKIGITAFGGFMVQRSALVIGSIYLSLTDIAEYAITMQMITVLSGFATIYIATYQPRIVQLRVVNDMPAIKQLYLNGQKLMFITFLLGGIGLLSAGAFVLDLIGSQTRLMRTDLIAIALVLAFIETNLIIAGTILVTKNEVPYFKAAIISGVMIVIGLFSSFEYMNLGLLTLLLIPLIINLSYQAWKWPLEVIRDLDINIKDIYANLIGIKK